MAQILVVDGDPVARSALETILIEAGHSVAAAEEGRSGLRSMDGLAPDLVITELYMDGMEGIEFLSRIREMPSRPEVIIVTARDRIGAPDMVFVAGLLGACGYVEKPIAPGRVLEVVGDVLSS